MTTLWPQCSLAILSFLLFDQIPAGFGYYITSDTKKEPVLEISMLAHVYIKTPKPYMRG